MSKLILYSRHDCHLCEQAMVLVQSVAPGIDCRIVDIEDDIGLISRYGMAIPVLQRPDDGTELRWPFDRDAVLEFLARE